MSLEAESTVSENDEKLLKKAEGGDLEALGELLMRHERSCYSLALRLARNQAEALDVCQDAFVRASRDIVSSTPIRNLRSWLFKLVVHAHGHRSASERARRRRERSYAVNRQGESVSRESSAEIRERRRQLDASLGQLAANRRLPIVLHYEQGLSYAEAAAVLEIPEGTVATNIRRGLEELRGLMSRAGFACAAPVLAATLSEAPALTVPASLTAFIKGIAAGSAGKAVAGAGTGAAVGAGSLALGWKLLAGLSLASLLAVGAYQGWRGWSSRPPAAQTSEERAGQAVGTAAPAARLAAAEAELAAALAKPASISLRRQAASMWLPEAVSYYGLDCAWAKDLWRWDQLVTVSHRGTLRECLEQLAEAAKIEVSFEAGMVRFWRPLPADRLAALKKRLANPDEQERCVAVWRLALSGDPQAMVPVMRSALHDTSSAVRFWALKGTNHQQRGVARITLPLKPAGIDREKWLQAALKSEEPILRRLGLSAVGFWGVIPDDGKAVIDQLKVDNPDSESRTAAIWAAGRCRFAPARNLLVELLLDEKARLMNRTANEAVRAIVRIGEGDLRKKLRNRLRTAKSISARQNAIIALGELRDAAAEADIRKATGGSRLQYSQVVALRILDAQRKRSVAELEKAATDRDFWVSRAACKQLERLGTSEARDALFRLARKDLYRAGAALIRLGDPRIAKLVLERAAHGTDNERAWAIQLIPRLPAGAVKQETLAVLQDALVKPDKSRGQRRRSAAAEALGLLRVEAAVPALGKACLERKSGFSAMYASKALARIGTASARTELLKLLKNPKTSSAAKHGALRILDQPGVLKAYLAAARNSIQLGHHPFFTRPYSLGTADLLCGYLKTMDRKLQILALSSLGEWGMKGPEGVQHAVELLSKLEDPKEVNTVAMSLGSFGNNSSVDPRAASAALKLIQARSDRPGVSDLCELLGKGPTSAEAVAALMKIAKSAKGDEQRQARRKAIEALGKLKARKAGDLLVAIHAEHSDPKKLAARTHDQWTRDVTAMALVKIGDPRALGILLAMLEEPKTHKARIITALAETGDRRAIPALLKQLRGGSNFNRGWTSSHLRRSPLATHPKVAAALKEFDQKDEATRSKRPAKPAEPPEVF